jgi:hypothetical protein
MPTQSARVPNFAALVLSQQVPKFTSATEAGYGAFGLLDRDIRRLDHITPFF